jgi:hypothetical protein
MDRNNSDEESDSENQEQGVNQGPNEAAFPNIDPIFKKLVRRTKKQLYDCIIIGPPSNSKKAQDNTLLVEYITKSNDLYEMLCKSVHSSKITPRGIEISISMFPIQTRESIKKLQGWLADFFSKHEYADTPPYCDYLEVYLKRYPCVQK